MQPMFRTLALVLTLTTALASHANAGGTTAKVEGPFGTRPTWCARPTAACRRP
jgi:hypothetical protein